MSARITHVLVSLAIATAWGAAMPGTMFGQAADGCSDCDFCPDKPWMYAVFDNFQNDILSIHQTCLDQECNSGIKCEIYPELVDLDYLAAALPTMPAADVKELVDTRERIEYVGERHALLVKGCKGSFTALFPLRRDPVLVAALRSPRKLASGPAPVAAGGGRR